MVLDDNNLLKGAFDRPGLKRNRQELEKSSRRLISTVLAVIWVFGFASLCGLVLGIMARVDAEMLKSRRLASIAIGLNLLGLFAALGFVALG